MGKGEPNAEGKRGEHGTVQAGRDLRVAVWSAAGAEAGRSWGQASLRQPESEFCCFNIYSHSVVWPETDLPEGQNVKGDVLEDPWRGRF